MRMLKYCCTKRIKKRRFSKKTKILTAAFLCFSLILLLFADGYVRKMIRGYPMSVATAEMLSQMDLAMEEVLSVTEFDGKSVDYILYGNDGAISVQTDIPTLNSVKTKYMSVLSNLLNKKGNTVKVSVPIGTLIGNEYTVGRGPEIGFKMKYSGTVTTNLYSEFSEAGINNTLHTVSLEVSNSIYILIPWGSVEKEVKTKYILAETVIVGKVPDAYTGVYGASDEVADEIFNHRAETE